MTKTVTGPRASIRSRGPWAGSWMVGLGLMTVFSPPAQAEVIERIVAVVDKEIILLSELGERLAPFRDRLAQLPPAQRRAKLKELREQTLSRMVDDKLLVAEARRLRITVTERDVDRAVSTMMRRSKMNKEQFAAALKAEGKTVAAYRRQTMRPQLLRYKVLGMTVKPKVSVGKDEIRALYNKDLRALGVQEKVRARHIFIAIPARADSKKLAELRAKATQILSEVIAKGSDFIALAKKYSEDSVTRAEGGDLGFFARGTLPATIEDTVFAAKKGQVLGPLRTARGFHIIKLIERRASAARPLAEVKDSLRQRLLAEKMEKATASWLAELRKRSHVDIRLEGKRLGQKRL